MLLCSNCKTTSTTHCTFIVLKQLNGDFSTQQPIHKKTVQQQKLAAIKTVLNVLELTAAWHTLLLFAIHRALTALL